MYPLKYPLHPDDLLLTLMCPAPHVTPRDSDGNLLVTNAEHYAYHNPHHDYYGAYHYEWLGITDLITFQLGKGGHYPALYRCPLWVYLNRHKLTYGDYIAGKYRMVEAVFPMDYHMVATDRPSPHVMAMDDAPKITEIKKYIEGCEFDAEEFCREMLA